MADLSARALADGDAFVSYLDGIDGDLEADEDIVTDLLNAASTIIEREAGREFVSYDKDDDDPLVPTPRRFDLDELTWFEDHHRRYLLDVGDMADVPTAVTTANADGTNAVTVSVPTLTGLPRNRRAGQPFTSLRFPAAPSWAYGCPTVGQMVTVTAVWGFPTIPDDVRLACVWYACGVFLRDIAKWPQALETEIDARDLPGQLIGRALIVARGYNLGGER